MISRVILAEQEALWHSAGLNGMYVTLDFDTIHMLYQMDLYLSGETPPVETYHTYHSQNGLQGTVIAMLYNLYGGSREGYLKLTRSATSFLSALCLAGFLVWILFNIGWIEAFCTALMILLSASAKLRA